MTVVMVCYSKLLLSPSPEFYTRRQLRRGVEVRNSRCKPTPPILLSPLIVPAFSRSLDNGANLFTRKLIIR